MKKLATCAAVLALSGIAHAGAVKTSIRRSRTVPEMEAVAAWAAPRFAAVAADRPVAAVPDAVLYSETVTLRQLSGTLAAPLSIGGAQPVSVPAGVLFSAWWVGDTRQACTFAASDGKSAYQLCLVSRGGSAMDTAIVRKPGQRIAEAATVALAEPLTLAGPKTAPAEEGFAWPRAHVFSYRQDGGVGIITEYNRTLLAPEIEFSRRVVVRKLAGTTLTLRCEAGKRDDVSKPLARQNGSHYKVEEVSVDLAAGKANASLCGGRIAIARGADGALSVESATPFASWWSLDEQRHEFRLSGEPFVYGAQTL